MLAVEVTAPIGTGAGRDGVAVLAAGESGATGVATAAEAVAVPVLRAGCAAPGAGVTATPADGAAVTAATRAAVLALTAGATEVARAALARSALLIAVRVLLATAATVSTGWSCPATLLATARISTCGIAGGGGTRLRAS